MGKYDIHRDFRKFAFLKLPLSPLLLPVANGFLTRIFKMAKTAKGVKTTAISIPGYRNGSVRLTLFEPEGIGDNAPCLIYLHGGGFVLKAGPYHKRLACEYALKTPCKVVFVDYRLAPGHAFPVSVEDCYAALEWVSGNAEALHIDREKIALGGDSAGGALAAAVCLMARDRKGPRACFQMLIYPVTDARQTTSSMREFTHTPLWNSRLNRRMWEMYLGKGAGSHREYASPLEASSLRDLPAAYVEVSEFDCLRDEGINYAEALMNSGVPVELNKTAGTVHGFDISARSVIVTDSVERRTKALKRALIAEYANEGT